MDYCNKFIYFYCEYLSCFTIRYCTRTNSRTLRRCCGCSRHSTQSILSCCYHISRVDPLLVKFLKDGPVFKLQGNDQRCKGAILHALSIIYKYAKTLGYDQGGKSGGNRRWWVGKVISACSSFPSSPFPSLPSFSPFSPFFVICPDTRGY
jgi:hypothetical protein